MAKCILHIPVDDKSSVKGKIKAFDDITWKKAKECYQARHEYQKQSKYFVIELPSSHDETIGYHIACYSAFTAFTKPTSTAAAESTVPSASSCTLRSTIDHATSSSGIFQRTVCFVAM